MPQNIKGLKFNEEEYRDKLAPVYALRMNKEVMNMLLGNPTVIGVGVGLKEVCGKLTSDFSLRVHVGHKFSAQKLSTSERIPSNINGVLIDVIDAKGGYFVDGFTDKYRPLMAGISIGHKDITGGTIGGFVRRIPDDGHIYIISNNHVLANCNLAAIGDECYQPAPCDTGTPEDTVALLAWFNELQYSSSGGSNCPFAKSYAEFGNTISKLMKKSTRFETVMKPRAVMNEADVALARVVSGVAVDPQYYGLGHITEVAQPAIGDTLAKAGRTTGVTYGVVSEIGWVGTVGYGSNKIAWFDGQCVAEPREVSWDVEYPNNLSLGGDSGGNLGTIAEDSPLYDENSKIIGQLFAGNEKKTIFTPMPKVLNVIARGYGQVEFI
ncbi:hypothetical protein KAU11_08720 [Candidatus Babeliales bacterium]|nr:hypothetical protein [Candidatus Babeliales bacterium]